MLPQFSIAGLNGICITESIKQYNNIKFRHGSTIQKGKSDYKDLKWFLRAFLNLKKFVSCLISAGRRFHVLTALTRNGLAAVLEDLYFECCVYVYLKKK